MYIFLLTMRELNEDKLMDFNFGKNSQKNVVYDEGNFAKRLNFRLESTSLTYLSNYAKLA